jgi:hypothetical protein
MPPKFSSFSSSSSTASSSSSPSSPRQPATGRGAAQRFVTSDPPAADKGNKQLPGPSSGTQSAVVRGARFITGINPFTGARRTASSRQTAAPVSPSQTRPRVPPQQLEKQIWQQRRSLDHGRGQEPSSPDHGRWVREEEQRQERERRIQDELRQAQLRLSPCRDELRRGAEMERRKSAEMGRKKDAAPETPDKAVERQDRQIEVQEELRRMQLQLSECSDELRTVTSSGRKKEREVVKKAAERGRKEEKERQAKKGLLQAQQQISPRVDQLRKEEKEWHERERKAKEELRQMQQRISPQRGEHGTGMSIITDRGRPDKAMEGDRSEKLAEEEPRPMQQRTSPRRDEQSLGIRTHGDRGALDKTGERREREKQVKEDPGPKEQRTSPGHGQPSTNTRLGTSAGTSTDAHLEAQSELSKLKIPSRMKDTEAHRQVKSPRCEQPIARASSGAGPSSGRSADVQPEARDQLGELGMPGRRKGREGHLEELDRLTKFKEWQIQDLEKGMGYVSDSADGTVRGGDMGRERIRKLPSTRRTPEKARTNRRLF